MPSDVLCGRSNSLFSFVAGRCVCACVYMRWHWRGRGWARVAWCVLHGRSPFARSLSSQTKLVGCGPFTAPPPHFFSFSFILFLASRKPRTTGLPKFRCSGSRFRPAITPFARSRGQMLSPSWIRCFRIDRSDARMPVDSWQILSTPSSYNPHLGDLNNSVGAWSRVCVRVLYIPLSLFSFSLSHIISFLSSSCIIRKNPGSGPFSFSSYTNLFFTRWLVGLDSSLANSSVDFCIAGPLGALYHFVGGLQQTRLPWKGGDA